MAYDIKELEQLSVSAVNHHNLYTIEQILEYLPCSKPTFYSHKLQQSDAIKTALHSNIALRKIPQKQASLKTQRRLGKWARQYDGQYVYVVRCADTSMYKIGISGIKPSHRLAMMQTGNPFELRIVRIAHCQNPETLERELHQTFKDFRVRGEWFDLTELQVSDLIGAMDKAIGAIGKQQDLMFV